MSPGRAICLVCTGSSCAKKRNALKRLRKALDTDAHLVPVKCQKICRGPVVGLRIDARLEWFSRIRKAKYYRAVELLLREGMVSRSLAKCHEKGRSGRLRN